MIQNIDPLALPSLSLQERRNLPQCAAVYFVLNGSSKILYIGGTLNLVQRWLTHHRCNQLTNMGDGIRIAWLECSEPALLPEIEAALIKHFQPSLNRTPVPGDKFKDKKQINVIMPIDDADRLKELADKQERSVSQMAAILIREALDRDKATANQDQGAA